MPQTFYSNGGRRVKVRNASDLTTGSNSVKAKMYKGKPPKRTTKPQPRGSNPSKAVRRQVAARKSYANRLPQRADRALNRQLWKARNKLKPSTATKLTALPAAAAAIPAAAAIASLITVLKKKK